jgi:hypothetical protein
MADTRDVVERLRHLDYDAGDVIEAAMDRVHRDALTEAADTIEALCAEVGRLSGTAPEPAETGECPIPRPVRVERLFENDLTYTELVDADDNVISADMNGVDADFIVAAVNAYVPAPTAAEPEREAVAWMAEVDWGDGRGWIRSPVMHESEKVAEAHWCNAIYDYPKAKGRTLVLYAALATPEAEGGST